MKVRSAGRGRPSSAPRSCVALRCALLAWTFDDGVVGPKETAIVGSQLKLAYRSPALAVDEEHMRLAGVERASPLPIAEAPQQPGRNLAAARASNARAKFGWSDLLRKWCGRSDSNRHVLRRRILNPLRLPIPPRPHFGADSNPGSLHLYCT